MNPADHFDAVLSGLWEPPSLETMEVLLPQYRFLKLLGRGGMGVVYRAVHASLERDVAVKVLPGDFIDETDVNFVQRFKNEARMMARMDHPGIVNVHDSGEAPGGLLYYAMEFVDGTDVARMVKSQGRLPPEHALAIAAHVCDALQYAHSQGVIHRDIKPANVLINRQGQVKVVDFGLARATDASGNSMGLTQTNLMMGTPDYMAPEALVDVALVDHRADLYAVGVMLYRMLTGEVPRGVFTPASELVTCDPRFDAIIKRAMESNRDRRYQEASEIRRDLDTILTLPVADSDIAAVPRPDVEESAGTDAENAIGSRERGRPALVWLMVSGALLISVFAFWLFTRGPGPASSGTSSTASEPMLPAAGPPPVPAVPATPAPSPAIEPKPEVVVSIAAKSIQAELPDEKSTPVPLKTQNASPVSSFPAGPVVVDVQPYKAIEASPKIEIAPLSTQATTPAFVSLSRRIPRDTRILGFEASFRDRYEKEAGTSFATSMTDLNAKYLRALTASIDSAKARNMSAEVAALSDEVKRTQAGDEVPVSDAKGISATLLRLRNQYRAEAAKFTSSRDAKMSEIARSYLKDLADYEAELTRSGRAIEAKGVKGVWVAIDKGTLALGDWSEIYTRSAVAESSYMPAQTSGVPQRMVVTPQREYMRTPYEDDTHYLGNWILDKGGEITIAGKSGRMALSGRGRPLPNGKLDIVGITVSLDKTAPDRLSAQFSAAPALEVLVLEGSYLPQVEFFEELKKLRELSLRPKLTPQMLAYIANMAELRSLAILSKITDDEIAKLSGLRNLERLTLSDAPTGVGFAGMTSSKRMTFLRLGTRTNAMNDDGVRAIVSTFPSLELLDLGSVESPAQITNACVPMLVTLRRLRDLGLDGRLIDDAALNFVGQMSALQTLKLRGTSVTGNGFASLPARNGLVSIHMENSALNDDGLLGLARFRTLNSVTIAGTKVSDTAVRKLETTLPGLKVMR